MPNHKPMFKRKSKITEIVLARYSDDSYYRSQIIDEQDGMNNGNTEFVYINPLALCNFADRLKAHRAINCRLSRINPRYCALAD